MFVRLTIITYRIFVHGNSKGDWLMKIYDAESFGLALRQRRKEMNYTQREISDLTGFSISFISDLENGKSTAEIGKAIYLANVLGLDIDIKSRDRR